MTRVFRNGRVVIDGVIYTTVFDYDTSILTEPVVIVSNPWSQQVFVYIPTDQERQLLGTKAKYITLQKVEP